jgi:hypothetical protein
LDTKGVCELVPEGIFIHSTVSLLIFFHKLIIPQPINHSGYMSR